MKNELINETSPYLLQHAHNPVHWQPWGTAALQLAKELDKPILISIGYSACHWCHVMEKESFENEATAAIMNEHFINIKIDREERPDIDHIYMDAVQAMTGSGGWPLNVFLTPDAKPFYGGTYFPPSKAHGRASWIDVLMSLQDAWKNRRADMERQAETLVEHLKKSNNLGQIKNVVSLDAGNNIFTKQDCKAMTAALLALADTVEGGFGKAPKFPQTFSINSLLQSAHYLKDENALKQAELSLRKMLDGGIYDQLGGGLCRYSTDVEWLAPHFEKMLYDNALFIVALGNAYLLTKNSIYKNAIAHVCNFIFTEMKSPSGGYYAAIDADSEGVEGKFYVWDKVEIDELLGKDAALFNQYYDVTEKGNWEEKNILRILKPLDEIAKQFGISLVEAERILIKSKDILLIERSKRIRPSTDDKIILGWNALLITSFCKAYAVLQEEKYKTTAEQLFQFMEKAFVDNNGSYFHTYKDEVAKYPAFLDDYAYFIEAAIQLQEITGNVYYLDFAKTLTNHVINNFSDVESPFFFYTKDGQADIIVRKIEVYDGATPSANAVMAKNFHYLSVIFDNKEWYQKGVSMIESLKTIIVKHPNSFGIWSATAMNMAVGNNEIAIIGKYKTPLLNEVLLQYIPNKILQSSSMLSDMPLLSKKPIFEKTLLYLCLNFECKEPFDNVSNLMDSLEKQAF
jgi:uncharacterized protein